MVRRTEKKNNKRTEKTSGTWKMISKQKETRGERLAGSKDRKMSDYSG